MCLDAINPFDTQVSTITITPVQTQASQESANWRIAKCAFRAFCFVAATFSGIAFFFTGEPFALVLSLIFGFLTFKLLIDDEHSTSYTSSRRINSTVVIPPPPVSSHHIHTTRVIHHHPAPAYTPAYSQPAPVYLPFGNSFSSGNIPSSFFPSLFSSSPISQNAPVGTRDPSDNFLAHYPSSRIEVVQDDPTDNVPVGTRSQDPLFDDSDDHATVGRRKE